LWLVFVVVVVGGALRLPVHAPVDLFLVLRLPIHAPVDPVFGLVLARLIPFTRASCSNCHIGCRIALGQ
jgi:hypothetical protein